MQQRRTVRGCVFAAVCTASLSACLSAHAQWTAIRLRGSSDYLSACLGTDDRQQGGWHQAGPLMEHQPVIWSGSSGSELNLSISPTDVGEVRAIWQGFQGGQLGAPAGHASLWHGTPGSRVDLDPGILGTFGSAVRAMRGTQQTGFMVYQTGTHAAMWTSTAASFVDLHPAGATGDSFAYATDGARQGGVASFAGLQHAALWSGSSASFVDLNPTFARESFIAGMAPGQQVGWCSTSQRHAALWSGSAASMVDLHPFPGFGDSALSATDGLVQVGSSSVPGGGSFGHAGIWFGTAASFVDLQAFLPAGYSASGATSVYEANGLIYVGGVASNPLSGTNEAFLWVGVPAPGSGAAMLLCACVLTRRCRGRREVA